MHLVSASATVPEPCLRFFQESRTPFGHSEAIVCRNGSYLTTLTCQLAEERRLGFEAALWGPSRGLEVNLIRLVVRDG